MSASDSTFSSQARFAGTALLMLFAAVLGGGAVFYGLKYLPMRAPAPGADVGALTSRIASDEARLATLEKSTKAADALDARIAKLEQAPPSQIDARLSVTETAMASLRQDFDARVGALERASPDLALRVANLEKRDASAALRHASAAFALANLARASESGSGFTSELATFRALMPEAGEAKDLERFAVRGAPVLATLAARFPQSADEALAAERFAHASTWLGRLWANISNLVMIRRVGPASGMDSESRLARAGEHLKIGDLDGAVGEMRGLSGAARNAIQPWLEDAQARLAIERDLAALDARFAGEAP